MNRRNFLKASFAGIVAFLAIPTEAAANVYTSPQYTHFPVWRYEDSGQYEEGGYYAMLAHKATAKEASA